MLYVPFALLVRGVPAAFQLFMLAARYTNAPSGVLLGIVRVMFICPKTQTDAYKRTKSQAVFFMVF